MVEPERRSEWITYRWPIEVEHSVRIQTSREAAGSSGTLTVGFFGRIVEDTDVLPTLRIGAADRAVLFSRFTLKCHCVIPVDRTKNEIFSRFICDPLT